MITPVIKLQDVNFSYQKNQVVLKEVNLEVLPGEFLGVVGPNGGGKTTLLKLILGLLQSYSGKIVTQGMIGYVPQFANFKRDFPITVQNMVLMGAIKNFGGYKCWVRQRVMELLEQFEIDHLASKTIGAISGGELQRAMIARALVAVPQILLLDEPIANVDMHGGENIFDLLKTINNKVTILVVSHDIGFISRYIRRVICVNRRLLCHTTDAVDAKFIEELYGGKVRVIRH